MNEQTVFDSETWNDPQFAFCVSTVVLAAMLWHAEPHDPLKADLLHQSCQFFATELEKHS